MEHIKAMFEAMEKDNAFSEEMRALMKGGNAFEIIAAAAKKGFVFTETDWQAYVDWSKTLSAKFESKEISPEELDKISGGTEDTNAPRKEGCWFHAASEQEFKYGAVRRRCNQYACTAPCLVEDFMLKYYECKCHGTDRCIESWHLLPKDTPDNCG